VVKLFVRGTVLFFSGTLAIGTILKLYPEFDLNMFFVILLIYYVVGTVLSYVIEKFLDELVKE